MPASKVASSPLGGPGMQLHLNLDQTDNDVCSEISQNDSVVSRTDGNDHMTARWKRSWKEAGSMSPISA